MNTPTPPPSSVSMRRVVAWVLLPCLYGAAVACFADDWLLTRMVLVMEPLIWVVACITGVYLIETNRGAYGISAVIGWLLFAAALRFPVAPQEPDSEVHLAISECVERYRRPRDGITVASVSWTDEESLLPSLREWQADILVLSGIPSGAVPGLAQTLERTALPHPDGMAILVSGRPVHCAGTSVVSLPGGVTALADIAGTSVPVIALTGTHARDLDGLAAGARDLSSPYTIVLGATATHGTFRQSEARMLGADLRTAPHRATAPALLLGLPAMPLYHTDRLWLGRGWRLADISTERIPGAPRLALIARLEPQ